MAVQKTAIVVGERRYSSETRWLDLEASEPLGFLGGQYLLVDSGLMLPSGKAAKRAYSIVSSDDEQRHFSLAVRRIAGGMVSRYMQEVAVGASLRFSGPWGKHLRGLEANSEAPALVVATDTGITAALGLVRSRALQRRLPRSRLVWLLPSPNYFLPVEAVRSCLPSACSLEVQRLPALDHPERVACCEAWLTRELTRGIPADAFLSGDGLVLQALRRSLEAHGVAEERIFVDPFFRKPAATS